MVIRDVALRRAQVALMRDRIAGLGGLSRPATAGPERTWSAPRSADSDRAEDLGFITEETDYGVTFVRRVAIDLRWHWQQAGLAGGVGPERLGRLGVRSADAATGDTGGDAVVLDIETLGLRGSGVLAFLVGLARERGDRLEVEQFLLADPRGEAALLRAVCRRAAGAGLLVTYNGRCFDVPVLASRCIINRVDPSVLLDLPHCDLLGPVRRLFRDRLVSCTLAHAEVGLLGHQRIDDLPGYEAPGRYREWLRGAPASRLRGVLTHNQVDLCMTSVLGARLAEHVDGRPVVPAHPADGYNLGLYLERTGTGEPEEVERHLRAAFEAGEGPWARRAGHRLARRLARRSWSFRGQADEIWQRLWEARPTDLSAARPLAIRLERRGQCAGALDVCRRVRRVCAEAGSTHHGALWTEDWDRRERRLVGRLRRQGATEPALEWATWMTPPRLPARR